MAKSKSRRKKQRRTRPTGYHSQLCARMNEAAAGNNLREIAEATGYHPETVRRYMSNGRTPVHFVAAFAPAFKVSLMWLMLGKGKMKG